MIRKSGTLYDSFKLSLANFGTFSFSTAGRLYLLFLLFPFFFLRSCLVRAEDDLFIAGIRIRAFESEELRTTLAIFMVSRSQENSEFFMTAMDEIF
jgi:hypothetical protein